MKSGRHNCFSPGWQECTACGGRIHRPGCTTKKRPAKDCCDARHRKLYNEGHKVGLYDSTVPMIKSQEARHV